jgi:uncharacterized protein (DUF433 family)
MPSHRAHPSKIIGAWLFKVTRIPVPALLNNLKAGATIDEFVDWLPGVTRDQVEAVLEHQLESLEQGRQAS